MDLKINRSKMYRAPSTINLSNFPFSFAIHAQDYQRTRDRTNLVDPSFSYSLRAPVVTELTEYKQLAKCHRGKH